MFVIPTPRLYSKWLGVVVFEIWLFTAMPLLVKAFPVEIVWKRTHGLNWRHVFKVTCQRNESFWPLRSFFIVKSYLVKKTKNCNTKQVSIHNPAMWARSRRARPRPPPRVRGLPGKICHPHHPVPSSVSLSCQLSHINWSMSSLQLWLAWVRGKPVQPAFTSSLPKSLKMPVRCLQASPQSTQHPRIQH